MDPLSLTASIVAVATLAGQACRGFMKLRGLHVSVPGRVHALHNEVVDLKVVLYQLAAVTEDREALLSSTPERTNIEHLLKRAEGRLTELDTINLRLIKACSETRFAIFRGPHWQREQAKLQTLQEEIKSVKSSLNVVLGASNSRDLARVRLDLENLSEVDSSSLKDLNNLRQEIVRVQMGVSQSFGPQFQLKTLRRVPDSAPCVNFALAGNVAALKDLFARGLASPQDVSSTRGYSLLRWALYGKQYETCNFLVYAGADIEYGPISAHDDNPKNKACDLFLQGALSKEEKDYLSCLTRMDDFTEEQNFTTLHRIVIGLSAASLEQEVQIHQEEIDVTDAKGRTALQWASALGDDRSVAILLSYQANPNHMDQQVSGPLLDAAAQNHPVCLRLLLEAGADPNHPVYKKLKKGNPLNVAARFGSDPIIIKTLLDFNSDIESCGPEGRTPLLHAALNDDVAVATLLLEDQANINAQSITAQTPLTAAIIHNSHHVLQLLLGRWQQYSACPHLQGPDLLQLAAFYGDLDTITILKGVDHSKIDYDKDFVFSDFETLLRDRRDMSETLILAFADLLHTIDTWPPTELVEDVVENGVLDQDTESELFSDAKEYQGQ
ncbi:MAG: hypothetical protein Q9165_004006 [Trypethelium subeluteriae]